MKTFIASIITFFVILSSVTVFIYCLNISTNNFSLVLDEIITDAKNENWTSCKENCDTLKTEWDKNKKWYEALKNHNDTNLINNLLLNLSLNVEFKERKSVIITANKLRLVFEDIYDDELPTLENII